VENAPISIVPVESGADLKAFIDLPYRLYAEDSNWRPSLRFERRAHLDPKKNPAAPSEGQRKLFLAYRAGKVVGRIAAFFNLSHLELYGDNTGFFGFFDCKDDKEIGDKLLKAAEDWLIECEATRIVGPAQWSVNDECGLLIDGFDTPNVMMMPHGRPYYREMIETYGYQKSTDMFAYQADLNAGYSENRAVDMMCRIADRDESISIRPKRPGVYMDEVRLVMDIFNDAWSGNWGFVPFSDAQIEHMAKDIKPLVFSEGFWVGELDGEAVAFIWMVPDLNSAARGLNGKLWPIGWAKLLWRLKISGVKQARIPLMGIRRKYHNTRKGLAIVAKLCDTVFKAGKEKGFSHCELSWILEDNAGMIRIIEQATANRYKTYRMYEKTID